MPDQIAAVNGLGIVQDLPPWAVLPDAWTGGRNVNFRDGVTTRIQGNSEILRTGLFAPQEVPHFLLNIPGTVNYWLAAGPNKTIANTNQSVSVFDGSLLFAGESVISPVAWTIATTVDNPFTGGLINGFAFLNDGTHPPVWWDGVPANVMLTVPGWVGGELAKAVRAYKYHLVAMNVVIGGIQYPEGVKWSAAAVPGALPASWTAAATNDAGFVALADSAGACVDGARLRDAFIIYKQHSTYSMTYVGGTFVMDFRQLFTTSGVLSRNCIAEWEGTHFVLTDGDVVNHDGVQLASVIDKKNRRWLFNNLNQSHYGLAFVAINKPRRELWVAFPSGAADYCNQVLIMDIATGKWGVRDPDGSKMFFAASGIVAATQADDWQSDGQAWNSDNTTWDAQLYNSSTEGLVLGELDDQQTALPLINKGRFVVVDVGPDFLAGEAAAIDISASLTREDIDCESPDMVKTATKLWPRISSPVQGQQVFFRAGSKMNLGEPTSWGPEMPFSIGFDDHVSVFVTGRWLAVQMRSEGSAPWQLQGIDISYTERSMY